MADAKRRGIALHAIDGFLAATARERNQTLVPRNSRTSRLSGCRLSIPGMAVEIRPVKSISAWFHAKERPGVA